MRMRDWSSDVCASDLDEANVAMHHCDLLINIGARFDDRVTGRLDAFAPNSTKIHVDIDPSSINKNVRVDLGIIGDAGAVLDAMLKRWKEVKDQPDTKARKAWWKQIDTGRGRDCRGYRPSETRIKTQYRSEEHTSAPQ